MQDELAVNYCQLAVVSTDPIPVTAAFRAGLGATFTLEVPVEAPSVAQAAARGPAADTTLAADRSRTQ